MSLFESQAPRPLADRLRPESLAEVVGQDHLLTETAPIGRMLVAGRLASLILWGPPGCGKTTIARLLAERAQLAFVPLSAVFSGVSDLRKAFDTAKERRATGQGTLLFVDEIHRFNRAQQDAFLPVVEDGTVTLVGATTENPSFELNAALLSRCQLMVLRRLDDSALERLLVRAERVQGRALPLTADARATLRAMADGDGRFLLNLAEEVFGFKPAGAISTGQPPVNLDGSDASAPDSQAQARPKSGEQWPLDTEALVASLQRRPPSYDKDREGHYNLISALHKSLRGSDVDAALYWFARMLEGGEDPRYLARRLIRVAVEDIGLADPQALNQAIAGAEAYERLGSPEGELALAQVVIYLGTAPKSNAGYTAYKAARKLAKQSGSLMPPAHILNAPTRLMRDLGYGAGYQYDHDAEDGFSGQDYFPEGLPRRRLYSPPERGFERELNKRLDYWARLRKTRQNNGQHQTGSRPDPRSHPGPQPGDAESREDKIDDAARTPRNRDPS